MKKITKTGLVLIGVIAIGSFGSTANKTEVKAPQIEYKEETPVIKEETATRQQKNAVKKAESYVDIMNFSESGLRKQLEFDGFETGDIDFALDNIEVDYNEEAIKQAKNYQEVMPMSDQELIDQLVFDGFTEEQAQYGVDNL